MLCDAGLWGIIGLWSFNCLLGPHGSAGCCGIVGLLHLGCDDVVVMVTHFYFAQWEFVDLVGLSEPQEGVSKPDRTVGQIGFGRTGYNLVCKTHKIGKLKPWVD